MNLILLRKDPKLNRLITDHLEQTFSDWKIAGVVDTYKGLKDCIAQVGIVDLLIIEVDSSLGILPNLQSVYPKHFPVIYIASTEKFAYQAFVNQGIDYLLKPIKTERFAWALNKARRYHGMFIHPEIVSQLLQSKEVGAFKNRFLARVGNRFSFVATSEVSYFFSSGGLTFLVKQGSTQRLLIDYNLTELEKKLLDPMKFYRVNRAVIINVEGLKDIKPYPNGRLQLGLESGSEEAIVVSRERVSHFKNWINQ